MMFAPAFTLQLIFGKRSFLSELSTTKGFTCFLSRLIKSKITMSLRNAQKQQILKILFSNLFLDGQSPCITLCHPFSEFVKLNHFRTWSGLVETLRTNCQEIMAFYPYVEKMQRLVA